MLFVEGTYSNSSRSLADKESIHCCFSNEGCCALMGTQAASIDGVLKGLELVRGAFCWKKDLISSCLLAVLVAMSDV